MTRLTALGPLPFLSGSTSKLMRWPSFSDFMPARSTAVMCTNTSRPPSSGLMNPYPRSPLKNFTTPPCAIGKLPFPIAPPPGPHGTAAGPDIPRERRRHPDVISAGPPREAERQSQHVRVDNNRNPLERGATAAPFHFSPVSQVI